MTGNDVREKYLKFFGNKGHAVISPALLVLKDDPTTLFTSSGMQPLVPYLMGKDHPEGKRLVDSQPSLRAQDIEEVGDNRHTTFFEMLGNWSLGDYFKKEQIPWIWEFITKELNLPKEKIYVSVFEGNEDVPEDKESYEIWKSLGVEENHIFKYGVKKNWWSRAGTPEQMPDGEIGGPDTEVFYEFSKIKHDSKFGEECHPNCDCGRFLEIGNSVFMQYKKENGKLVELPQKNVDFGGGLERLTAATNNDPDVFKTDFFWPLIEKIEEISGKKYEGNEATMRVIADHIKASTFLIADGVIPGNKLQSYVLRRLLRRAATKAYLMDQDFGSSEHFQKLIEIVFKIYNSVYLKDVEVSLVKKEVDIEIRKFRKNLEQGVKEVNNYFEELMNKGGGFPGNEETIAVKAFEFYQSFGIPVDVIYDKLKQEYGFILAMGQITLNGVNKEFEKLKQEHQELSRKSSKEKFKIV